MSSSVNIYFKEIKTFNSAVAFAVKYVNSITFDECFQMLCEEKYYLPINKYQHLIKDSVERTSALSIMNEESLYRFLSFRFIYLKKYGLLGLIGSSYPRINKYFNTEVYFQDSCDQDYDRKYWGEIKCFLNIYDECMKMSKEDIVKGLGDSWELDDLEDSKCDYYARTLAYKRIYGDIGIERWLWSDKSISDDSLETFTIGRLNKWEECFDLNRKICARYKD